MGERYAIQLVGRVGEPHKPPRLATVDGSKYVSQKRKRWIRYEAKFTPYDEDPIMTNGMIMLQSQ